jgi:hypothetical protein
MIASAKALPSTNGAPVAGKKVDQLLVQLNRLWKARHVLDLGTRHQTGVLLNQLLGLPTERQTYGGKVLEKVSKRLRLPKGELSRMRHFAHRFPDLADLQRKRPGVTWTGIRKLLPSLAQNKAGKEKARGKRDMLRRVTNSLHAAASGFRRLGSTLNDEQKAKLLQQVQDIVKAASRCLKVRWSVVER